MTEQLERLFSYGTLQQPDVQRELFGRTLDGEADAIIGFVLEDIILDDPSAPDGKWKHFIAVRSANDADRIAGTAVMLTPSELAAADRYEPDPYVRIETTLASGKRAWVYAHKRA